VRKNPDGDPRYEVKHYFLRRNDDKVDEIPAVQVRLVDTPVLWPPDAERTTSPSGFLQQSSPQGGSNLERAKDQDLFSEFYPNLKALFSKSIGALYWKGSLVLVDGSHANVVAIEDLGDGTPSYSITMAGENPILDDVSANYKERRFRSARQAVLRLEKDLNRALYLSKKG
jgi:hypothetical protein